jgi:hypothetical protein
MLLERRRTRCPHPTDPAFVSDTADGAAKKPNPT